jgi:hypothetical protein
METGKLEKAAKEVNACGFFRRNLKKIGLAVGGLLLAASVAVSCLTFSRDGKTIKGRLDGRIDGEYYHSLVLEDPEISDISQLEDLVAEVYYLTSGRKIEDDFRFNFYGESKPVRIQITEYFSGRQLNGLNWFNGDLYVKNRDMAKTVRTVFHEIGHGKADSALDQICRLMSDDNTEPAAEKNAIDSFISLMYLDPDLGYVLYADYITCYFSNSDIFESDTRWGRILGLNQIRVIKKGDLEIRERYPSDDEITQTILENTDGKTADQLISLMYEGILNMFTQRFGQRHDFAEKYNELKNYFKYGTTDRIYDTASTTVDQVLKKAAEKEQYLEQAHSNIIKRNLAESLITDYLFLGEEEKAGKLESKITQN